MLELIVWFSSYYINMAENISAEEFLLFNWVKLAGGYR